MTTEQSWPPLRVARASDPMRTGSIVLVSLQAAGIPLEALERNPGLLGEMVAALREGWLASKLRQSDHECHNDDCGDAVRTRILAAVLDQLEGRES